jgi:hypothetical protein
VGALAWRQAGDHSGVAHCCLELGNVARRHEEYGTARCSPKASGYTAPWAIESGWRSRSTTWGCSPGTKATSVLRRPSVGSASHSPGRSSRPTSSPWRCRPSAASLRRESKTPRWPADQADYERNFSALQAGLDASTLAAAWNEGSALSPEQAIALAMEADQAL